MRLFSRKKAGAEIPSTANFELDNPHYLLGYQVFGFQGIGKRENQQDSYDVANARDVVAIKKNGLLVVVADGMGGMAGGKEASEMIINSMRASFEQMDRECDISDQLYDAVQTANASVFGRINGKGGSTLVVCIFYDEKLYFASVGDSGLYLLRDGQLCRLNREQNCLEEDYISTICSGSMDPSLARNGSDREALTQFVGKRELEDVDILKRPLPLQARDVILACSDGVDGSLPESLLTNCLTIGSPRDMCTRLEDEIFKANLMHQDNYTAVVIQCNY